MEANEILCYIYFQKLALLGKLTTPLSDFWVLAGSFMPEKTPTLPLPRVHCLGEILLPEPHHGRNFEHASKAVVFLKPAPL